nr:nucleotide exchange factor GrpE [Bacilli bacterium]
MSDTNERDVTEEIIENEEVVDESTSSSSDEGIQEEAPKSEENELERLQMQVRELENRLLRTYADMENLRRRTKLEKEELASFANAKLITDLLPVLDNLELALKAGETHEGSDLVKGVNMVFKQFVQVFDQAGVTTLDPVGEPFDPNRHEAVMSEPVEDTEAGIVIATLRTGYLLGEKVLRPAMVKVSS